MLFTPSVPLYPTVLETLFDVPDLSMAPLNPSRPLPSWTADKFALIVAYLDDGASWILLSMLGPSMRCRSVPWVLLFESSFPLAGNLRDIEIYSFACAALPPLAECIGLLLRS